MNSALPAESSPADLADLPSADLSSGYPRAATPPPAAPRVAFARWLRFDYDAILMDINMPRMNGFEAAACIRKIEAAPTRLLMYSRIPIIGMTAQQTSGPEFVKAYTAAGIDDFLTFPVRTHRPSSRIGCVACVELMCADYRLSDERRANASYTWSMCVAVSRSSRVTHGRCAGGTV